MICALRRRQSLVLDRVVEGARPRRGGDVCAFSQKRHFCNCVPGTHFRRKKRILTKCTYGYPRRRRGADGRLPPRGQVPNFGGVAKHITARCSRSLVLDRVVEAARLSWYVLHSANLACFRQPAFWYEARKESIVSRGFRDFETLRLRHCALLQFADAMRAVFAPARVGECLYHDVPGILLAGAPSHKRRTTACGVGEDWRRRRRRGRRGRVAAGGGAGCGGYGGG